MVIFNSYVSLPEGTQGLMVTHIRRDTSLRDLRRLGSAWAHAPVLAVVGSAARCTSAWVKAQEVAWEKPVDLCGF